MSNEPLPGWVEAKLVDAEGTTWRFFDKPPIFTSEAIDASTEPPADGELQCRIVDERVSDGRAHVEVETVDVDSGGPRVSDQDQVVRPKLGEPLLDRPRARGVPKLRQQNGNGRRR